MNNETYQKQAEIDFHKKYNIPEEVKIVRFNEKVLIIATELANWLVFSNEKQLQIFNYLYTHNIEETMHKFSYCKEDFLSVITQLEAKQFESRNTTQTRLDGLTIYLTNKCNLRCKHCYMYSGQELENEINIYEIEKLLSEFKANGGNKITFTGGEVTLRNDFINILIIASRLDLIITVLSNGTLWDKELIDKATPYINEIQVSIDGFDEQSNAKVRGNDQFVKVYEALNMLLLKGLKVTLAITPLYEELKNNQKKYMKFAQNLITKYKKYDFQIKFSYELIEGRDVTNTININNNYYKLINEVVEAIYPLTEVNTFILNHEDNFLFNNCGYGGITISAIGEIFFCNRISEISSYGNIRNLEFDDIIKLSEKAESLSNINNLQPCNKCELKYICGGGCRIKNFPTLTKVSNLFEFDLCSVNPRICRISDKEKYYQLMIETNEELYR